MPEYGEPLTDREKELLQLVSTGVTNREVGKRLSISVNTVKVHLRNIYTKLGAESRTEATMIAVREGMVTLAGAEVISADENGITRVRPEVSSVAFQPPLSWFRRVALLVALLVAVTSVAVTWPRSGVAGNEVGLPPELESGASSPQVAASEESLWHERAQMPTRRAYLALAVVEGRILAISGQTPEGTTAAVEIYDPEEDIWTRGRDKPTPASYVSAGVIGTDVYVPGGCDADSRPTRTVEVYDAQADSWREASPLPEPRCAYALATLGGTLYLFGGWGGERYVSTVYIYDSRTDTWSKGRSMITERGLAAAAALAGRLYVVGGYDGKRELAACTIYDPETGTSEACTPLAVGRGGLGLVAVGGQLYAIGGGVRTSYLSFNERYSPNDDTWNVAETPLVGEWRSPGVVLYENAIYAIGGWSGDYLSLNQVYEPLPFRIFIPVSPKF